MNDWIPAVRPGRDDTVCWILFPAEAMPDRAVTSETAAADTAGAAAIVSMNFRISTDSPGKLL